MNFVHSKSYASISDAFFILNKIALPDDKYRHSIGVASKAERLIRSSEVITKQMSMRIIQAAILHDIGYSAKINLETYHPVNGYNYLKSIGYPSAVSKLVLLRTFSHKLAKRQDIVDNFYSDYELTESDEICLKVLTYCDLHTSQTGEEINIEERCEEIKSTHGEDSEEYLNMKSVSEDVCSLVEFVESKVLDNY